MYILDDRLIFIAHPRTASRATRDALSARRVGGHHRIDEAAIKALLAAGGKVVCTQRNMFDVLVSWYYNLCINGEKRFGDPPPTFPTWLKLIVEQTDIRYLDRTIYPLYHFGLPYANYVLRYETLQDDLDNLAQMIGIPPLKLPSVGVSHRDRDYRSYYTPETSQLVEALWAEDFKLTGYEW